MKSTPEPFDKPLVIPDKPAPQPKPDTFTEVNKGIYRNDRTGQLETRIPLPAPAQQWHPVFDEQCED